MNSHLLPGAALLSLVSGVANAAPTPIGTFNEVASASNPAPAGSTGLGPGGAVGGIGGPIDFTAPFAGTLIMTVTPTGTFTAGDVYQAFVDGHSLGFTTPVPLFGTQFTSGTFTTPVSQGLNNFDINDQVFSYLGFQAPYGPANTTVPASFSPSGVTVILAEELPSAVPEPGSLALFGAWLVGLAMFWRRGKLGQAISETGPCN
jgi:hypothetical protein